MNNKLFYKKPVFWVIFIFVYSIIIFRHVNIDINEPGYGRGWFYGDNFSDRNVESAAKYYMVHGLKSNYGLPTYFYTDTITGNEMVYTHYPPMAEWIGGAVAKLTKDYSFKTLSILPLVLSVFLFFMIYHILSQWIKSNKISFLSASLLVLSNYFIAWADDIHQHLYVEFYRWSFVYLWWLYLKSDIKNYLLFTLLVIIYTIVCFHSFEPYAYIAIVIIGLPIALKKKLLRWEVAALLCIPFFCLGIRLVINTLYFGDFQTMLNDMTAAYTHRIGTNGNASELGRQMTLIDYLHFLPKTRLHRLGHFYLFPSLVIVLLAILGLIKIKKVDNELFRLAIVIYIASISWIILMPQHALIHIFTLRHIGIFIGIVMGYGLVAYYSYVKKAWLNKNAILIMVHIGIIAYAIFYFSVNTFYYLYMKYGWFYPHFGTEKFKWSEHFLM